MSRGPSQSRSPEKIDEGCPVSSLNILSQFIMPHLNGVVNVSSMNEATYFLETYVPVLDNSPQYEDEDIQKRPWIRATVVSITPQRFETNEDAWEFMRVYDLTQQATKTVYVCEVEDENSVRYAYYYRGL